MKQKKIKEHGELTEKQTDVVPWHNTQIDCVGLCTSQKKFKENYLN